MSKIRFRQAIARLFPQFFSKRLPLRPARKKWRPLECESLEARSLPSATLPANWTDRDIGSPGLAGSASSDGSTWTLSGSGADIWNNSDQFNLVSQPASGNVTLVARVDSLTDTDPWTKAGVMLRADTSAGAIFADVVATPGNGVSFQWRSDTNGSPSYVDIPGISGPVWVELTRQGDEVEGFYRTDTSGWTEIGSPETLSFNSTIEAGLAITAHNNSALATATMEDVSLSQPAASVMSGQDIGLPLISGSSSASGGVWTVSGTGTGLGGVSDQGYITAAPVSGDTTLTAQLTSLTASSDSAQAGLLIRQDNSAGSPFAAVVSTNSGLEFEYRATAFGSAVTTPATAVSGPVWVRLVRDGSNISAFYSTDDTTWTQVGSSQAIALSTTPLAGFFAASGDNTTQATATFDSVSVVHPASFPASGVDIGNPGVAGSDQFDGTSWTVSGGGSDIWGTGDQFHFVPSSVTGDGTLVALITSQSASDGWAKSGVMFRNDLSADSAWVAVFDTPGNGLVLQWRNTANGTASMISGPSISGPVWVKLVRDGDSFSGYYSTDGESWTQIGTAQTVVMSSTIDAGLAVTSHNNTTVSTAVFSDVTLNNEPLTGLGQDIDASSSSQFTNFQGNGQDIGTPGRAGSDLSGALTWTVTGGGNDIWNTSDNFHFVSNTYSGDGTLVARVDSQTDSDSWAKSGVMFRNDTSASSVWAGVFDTPGNGIVFQWRDASGDSYISGPAITGSVWVRLDRQGDTFTGYYSTDGKTWTELGSHDVAMNSTVDVGLAVTSHNDAALSTAVFSYVGIYNPGQTIVTPVSTGATSLSGTEYTITGAGLGLGGTADQAHVVASPVSGDTLLGGELVDIGTATQAGLLLRNDLSAGSAYASLLMVAGQGLVFQARDAAGGSTVSQTVPGITSPVWLQLIRQGDTVTAAYSTDDINWTTIGSETVDLTAAPLAGMVVASGSTQDLATATFDQLQISAPEAFSGTGGLDIGSPGIAGASSFGTGTYTLSGSGSASLPGAESGRFLETTVTGDVMVTARIASWTTATANALAGVMVRDSSSAGEPFAALWDSPDGIVTFQWRDAAGGTIQQSQITGISGPVFLKQDSMANVFTAFYSTDGTTWTQVGSAENVAVGLIAQVGLAVSSQDPAALATAAFDNVSIQPHFTSVGVSAGSVTIPTPGTVTLTSSGTLAPSQATWTYMGASSDSYNALEQPLGDNQQIVVRVDSLDGSSALAKAGLILAASDDPSAAFVGIFATPGWGVVMLDRTSSGANAQSVGYDKAETYSNHHNWTD